MWCALKDVSCFLFACRLFLFFLRRAFVVVVAVLTLLLFWLPLCFRFTACKHQKTPCKSISFTVANNFKWTEVVSWKCSELNPVRDVKKMYRFGIYHNLFLYTDHNFVAHYQCNWIASPFIACVQCVVVIFGSRALISTVSTLYHVVCLYSVCYTFSLR